MYHIVSKRSYHYTLRVLGSDIKHVVLVQCTFNSQGAPGTNASFATRSVFSPPKKDKLDSQDPTQVNVVHVIEAL